MHTPVRIARMCVGVMLVALTYQVNAGVLTCTAMLYLKRNFGGDHSNITLAPQGDTDKMVVNDVAALTKGISNDSDDGINSALLLCSCTSGNCTADYPKVTLRVFSPNARKYGGGDKIDIFCLAYDNPNTCNGAFAWMPAGWSSRSSGAALLYNLPDYTLPAPPGVQAKPKRSPLPGGRRHGRV